MKIRTRIAPSPTGIAHIGTAYIALINYAFAKSQNGKFILRIEDTDRERYVPRSEQVIFNALRWLDLKYDEGPEVGGPFKPYTQSKRLTIYKKHADDLIKKDKAYFCFCSPERLAAMRKAQQQKGKLPMYDGTCRKLAASKAQSRAKKEKHVIRLKVPKSGNTSWKDLIRGKISFANKTLDDQVLLKSDGYPTYHLAVVVDDHLMQISHVIRGEEWISSTPNHLVGRYQNLPIRHSCAIPIAQNFPSVTIMSQSWHTKSKGFFPKHLLITYV
jgi:glutamyl-tRNA synthetase